MANASYDNFFRNSDFVNGNSNINIIGQGHAVLDGNVVNNNDAYATYGPGGSATIYRYFGIMFANVNNFTISGLQFIDFMHWNTLLQKCSNGSMHDIYLSYYTSTVNQDGIDVSWSHDIEIYNIKGFTGDDFGGIFCCNADYCVNIPALKTGDCYNINKHDLMIYASGSHGLLMICGNGNKLHGINFDNVKIYYCSTGTIQFGTPGFYDTPPSKDEFYNINSDGLTVEANSDTHEIHVNNDCQDVTITNYTDNSGKTLFTSLVGLDIDDFFINGVEYP
jgi:hypothetical protein